MILYVHKYVYKSLSYLFLLLFFKNEPFKNVITIINSP